MARMFTWLVKTRRRGLEIELSNESTGPSVCRVSMEGRTVEGEPYIIEIDDLELDDLRALADAFGSACQAMEQP